MRDLDKKIIIALFALINGIIVFASSVQKYRELTIREDTWEAWETFENYPGITLCAFKCQEENCKAFRVTGHNRCQFGSVSKVIYAKKGIVVYSKEELPGVRVAFSPADKDPNHFANPFELDMYDYDPLNDVLMQKPNCDDNCTTIPNPQLVNPQGAKYGDGFLFCNGLDASQTSQAPASVRLIVGTSKKCQTFSFSSGLWSDVPDMKNTERVLNLFQYEREGRGSLVSILGSVWIVSGDFTTEGVQKVEVFREGMWHEGPEYPLPVQLLRCVVISPVEFMCCGGMIKDDQGNSELTDKCYTMDARKRTNQWTEAPTMGQTFSGGLLGKLRDKNDKWVVVAAGGMHDNNSPKKAQLLTLPMNGNNEWRLLGQLNVPEAACGPTDGTFCLCFCLYASAEVDGRLFAVGTLGIWEYIVDDDAWIEKATELTPQTYNGGSAVVFNNFMF